jgi:hypothetical protein
MMQPSRRSTLTGVYYRRVAGYEAAYTVHRGGRTLGEVEAYDDRAWVAELNDGRRGFGRTRNAAVNEALTHPEAR